MRGNFGLAGVSKLLASLGHTLNTETLMKTDEQKKKKVVSKSTILCRVHSQPPWAAAGRAVLSFTVASGRVAEMWPLEVEMCC